MKFRFLILLPVFILTLAGCGKEDDSTAPVATGVVKGSVLPYYSAREIYLVSGTDTLKTVPNTPTPPDYTGTFEFNQVPPGNYTLGVNPIINFEAPLPVAINVSAGQTVENPRFELYNGMNSNGIMSLTYNDTVYSGSPTVAGNMVYLATPRYTFKIIFPPISGQGIYTPATHNMLRVEIASQKNGVFIADATQGAANLNISSYNPVSKFGHGTFSFTAVNPGKPDMIITDGTLHSVRLNP